MTKIMTHRYHCSTLLALMILSTAQVFASQPSFFNVTVLDAGTGIPVSRAYVVHNDEVKRTTRRGKVRFLTAEDRVTLTVAYKAGSVRRLSSFHDIPITPQHIVLRINNALPLRKETTFSLRIPFGQLPSQTDATVLTPGFGYSIADITSGVYDNVSVYRDQLQHDRKFTLVMAALDQFKLPFSYGYLLDKSPGLTDSRTLFLQPPFAVPLSEPVVPVAWQKLPDPIDPSDPTSHCDYSAAPYTVCGVIQAGSGIFSWMNVIRKGQTFTTPGAFLPSRTEGANPLMPLPDGINELVGHDNPLGFFPMNYSRSRYTRTTDIPLTPVNILMPNVLIGTANQTGAQAIAIVNNNGAVQINWTIGAGNNDLSDVTQIDYGKLRLIWENTMLGFSTQWEHLFATQAGNNLVALPTLPQPLAAWQPTAGTQFVDTTVTLAGTDAGDGFDETWALWQLTGEPLHAGDTSFDVIRWR